MKQQTTEIIKIVVGILLGTVAVMGVIGFMLNIVLHPFIIILALQVLFVMGIIIAGVTMGYKGIIVVVGSFVFGWFGFNPYYKYACGPNSSDVKVMKPMAEKISTYIVKNGIPKSLKDIPDLPYELVGCEKEINYGDENDIPRKLKTQKSRWMEKNERCHFKNITLHFSLDKSLELKNDKWNGYLDMDSTRGTGLMIYIDEGKNHQFYRGEISLNGKHTGICKSWRQ